MAANDLHYSVHPKSFWINLLCHKQDIPCACWRSWQSWSRTPYESIKLASECQSRTCELLVDSHFSIRWAGKTQTGFDCKRRAVRQ